VDLADLKRPHGGVVCSAKAKAQPASGLSIGASPPPAAMTLQRPNFAQNRDLGICQVDELVNDCFFLGMTLHRKRSIFDLLREAEGGLGLAHFEPTILPNFAEHTRLLDPTILRGSCHSIDWRGYSIAQSKHNTPGQALLSSDHGVLGQGRGMWGNMQWGRNTAARFRIGYLHGYLPPIPLVDIALQSGPNRGPRCAD